MDGKSAASAGSGSDMFLPEELCDDLCCCVICFEPFSDSKIPKALPCLHTFCRDCLASNLTAHKKLVSKRAPSRSRSNDMKNFSCPVCKEVTKVPENGIDGFKNDFRIRKISEVLARTRNLPRQQSYAELSSDKEDIVQKPKEEYAEKEEDSERRVLCDICKFSEKEKDAALYCLECAKMMCRECAEDHINTAITKDHDIVNANEHLPTESVCQLHPAEILKYFCVPCKMPVCMACTYAESHKEHEIVRLNEHTKQIREKLTSLLDNCQESIPDVNKKMKMLASLEQTLNSKEKTAQKAILQRTLEEISKVRSNQSKMEQELEEICRHKYKEIQKKKKEVADITEKFEFTKTLMTKGQDLQLVCMENELVQALTSVVQPPDEASSDEISFTDLGKYEGLVEDIEIIQKEESSTRSAILADIKSVVSQMRMFTVGRSDAKPELLRKVGRKGTKDGEFNFPSGVVILPNGDVAVADLHNHRVQIFTADGEYKNKFGNEDFKPCGITVTRDGLLAVTDCNLNANCIKVYTPDGIHKQSLGVGEFDYPFSVAMTSKGRYVVSDPAVNKITVISADGSLHRRFGTRSKFCFYLTVNTRDEIILSDWYNHCVKVFASNGQLLRKIGSHGMEDGQLLIPLGVVTDLRGNILVLDCKCGRLSMFSPDGRFMKNVINKTHGIEFSRAIAIAKDGRMVITTGDNKREVPNELHMYQLL